MAVGGAEYDIAALVYPGYHPEPRWKELGLFPEGQGEWFNVKDAKPKWPGHDQPRVPVWGYENEADPKVMEKKIEAASSHGVNVFIFDWYWYGERPFLEGALADGFLGAKNNDKMKFFLMWANHNWSDCVDKRASARHSKTIWLGGVDGEAFRRMTRRAIEKFLSRPNYYRICGKPVFMIYEVGSFVKGMGGMENAAAALRQFDADCAKAGLGGVHIMACSWGQCKPEHIAALGIESATMYTYAHHVRPKGDYAQWAEKGLAKLDSEKARLKGLKAYFAHASVGWDNNPRFPEKMPCVTGSLPEKFEKVRIWSPTKSTAWATWRPSAACSSVKSLLTEGLSPCNIEPAAGVSLLATASPARIRLSGVNLLEFVLPKWVERAAVEDGEIVIYAKPAPFSLRIR